MYESHVLVVFFPFCRFLDALHSFIIFVGVFLPQVIDGNGFIFLEKCERFLVLSRIRVAFSIVGEGESECLVYGKDTELVCKNGH